MRVLERLTTLSESDQPANASPSRLSEPLEAAGALLSIRMVKGQG
jgi:hypothetical protein